MKTILAFLFLSVSLCAASSFGGGCRGCSFSSSRSMSLSASKSSFSSSSSKSFSSSSSAKSYSSSYRPSSYSAYRSYSYRPVAFTPYYTPYSYSYTSPFNNVWFWMYMMHNNNSVFDHHSDLESWDGNAEQNDKPTYEDGPDSNKFILYTFIIVMVVFVVVFIIIGVLGL